MELPTALISLFPILWTIASARIDPKTMVECMPREYKHYVEKPPYIAPDGTHIPCKGYVTVMACYGRCKTSEIGDFQFPYKISYHTVCTYSDNIVKRLERLNCPGYPDPTVEVFDVERCECKICRYDSTSCENL